MLPPRANHLRPVPVGRYDAPRVFRTYLHRLAATLAAQSEGRLDPPYVLTARALLHCAEMSGAGRCRIIRQLERQFATELFRAMPPADPLEVLGGKA